MDWINLAQYISVISDDISNVYETSVVLLWNRH
jgi:hypothetical protein